MSTGSCCFSSLFLIVCIRSFTSASIVPSPEVTAADQFPANNIVEERGFAGAAAAAADIGPAGQSINWSGATKTVDGDRQGVVAKRMPIEQNSGYFCCIGDIFCVSGRCESASSLVDFSWLNKRSQWRQHAINRHLHLEDF